MSLFYTALDISIVQNFFIRKFSIYVNRWCCKLIPCNNERKKVLSAVVMCYKYRWYFRCPVWGSIIKGFVGNYIPWFQNQHQIHISNLVSMFRNVFNEITSLCCYKIWKIHKKNPQISMLPTYLEVLNLEQVPT